MMLTALPPSVTFYDLDKLTGGNRRGRAAVVLPDREPGLVRDHPETWLRDGPSPDSDGVHYDDPTAQEALEAVQRSFTRRAR